MNADVGHNTGAKRPVRTAVSDLAFGVAVALGIAAVLAALVSAVVYLPGLVGTIPDRYVVPSLAAFLFLATVFCAAGLRADMRRFRDGGGS
jgi:hypothetical protein